MLIFDTSAVIEWLKGNDKLSKVEDQIAISTITAYEMLWNSQKRNRKVISAVDFFIEKSQILNITLDVAREAAVAKMKLLAAGKDKPMADLLIAAVSKVNNMELYSFDRDFQEISNVLDFNLILF